MFHRIPDAGEILVGDFGWESVTSRSSPFTPIRLFSPVRSQPASMSYWQHTERVAAQRRALFSTCSEKDSSSSAVLARAQAASRP